MSKSTRSRFLPSSQMFLALCRCAQRRERSREPAPAAVSCEVPRMRLRRQCLESFGLSKSSSKRNTIFSPLPSARSSSSKTGSDTTYFSLAQLPRSRSRQRSLQKGKSAWTAESVSTLQIGHLCFMVRLFFSVNSAFSVLKRLAKRSHRSQRSTKRFLREKVYLSSGHGGAPQWRCDEVFLRRQPAAWPPPRSRLVRQAAAGFPLPAQSSRKHPSW